MDVGYDFHMQHKPKMNPIIHNSPEFKEARKAFQGINATTKGSVEKSKRRHDMKKMVARKMSKRQIAAMHKRDGVVDKTPLDFSGAGDHDYR